MSRERDEEIWDEAYLFGLNQGKEAGLDIAKQQLKKAYQTAHDILNVELRLAKVNSVGSKESHFFELHDPYRGLDK